MTHWPHLCLHLHRPRARSLKLNRSKRHKRGPEWTYTTPAVMVASVSTSLTVRSARGFAAASFSLSWVRRRGHDREVVRDRGSDATKLVPPLSSSFCSTAPAVDSVTNPPRCEYLGWEHLRTAAREGRMMTTPFSMSWAMMLYCRCHRRPGQDMSTWQKAIKLMVGEDLDGGGLSIVRISGDRAATSDVLARELPLILPGYGLLLAAPGDCLSMSGQVPQHVRDQRGP